LLPQQDFLAELEEYRRVLRLHPKSRLE
jgi:hypothetical protein